MIILVAGSDAWRVEQDISRLVAHFQEKFDPQGYNVLQVSFGDGYEEALQSVNSAPFLAEQRMVLLQDIPAQQNEVDEKLITLIEVCAESTILVLSSKLPSEELSGLISCLENLESQVTIHRYDAVKKLNAQALQGLLGHYRITLSRSQQEELIASSPSLESLHTLFQALSSGASGAISPTEWRNFFPYTEERQVFDFVDALIRKDAVASLSFLDDFSQQSSSLMPLWSLLYTQLRKYYYLLRAGDDFSAVAKDLGVSLFEQNKIKSALASRSLHIEALYRRYASLEREGRANQEGTLRAIGCLVDLTFLA